MTATRSTEVLGKMVAETVMTLTDFVAVCGLIFGLTGAILGVLNYLRDRVRLAVTLRWDMDVTPGTPYDANKKWGVIRVTNVGRRTTYISHAALRLPKGQDGSHLVIMDSIKGDKLSEGDPTIIYMVSQDGLQTYACIWRQIIVEINDSTGKVWTSKRMRKSDRPSWASGKESNAV